MKILKEIFKRPVTIIFMVILIIGFGILSTVNMPINLLPDIGLPFLEIQTVYVGSDAKTIEEQITEPMEKSISSVSALKNVESYSVDNASLLIIQFEYGTDLNKKQEELKERINKLSLPDGCQAPQFLNIDLNSKPIAQVILYSQNEGVDALNAKVEGITHSFNSIDGVGSVSVAGAPDNKITIKSKDGLEMLTGLIVNELVANKSLDIPLGTVKENDESIAVSNSSKVKSLDDIKKLEISYNLDKDKLNQVKSIQDILNTFINSDYTIIDYYKTKGLQIKDYADSVNETSAKDLYDRVCLLNKLADYLNNHSIGFVNNINNQIKDLNDSHKLQALTDIEKKVLADQYEMDVVVLNYFANVDTTLVNQYLDLLLEYKNQNITYINLVNEIHVDNTNLANVYEHFDLNNFKEMVLNNDFEDKSKLFNFSPFIYDFINNDSFSNAMNMLKLYKMTYTPEQITNESLFNLLKAGGIDSLNGIKLTKGILDLIRYSNINDKSISFSIETIATVDYNKTLETTGYYNSRPAIMFSIFKTNNSNANALVKEIKKAIDNYNGTSDSSLVLVDNQADFISDSLNNAIVSLLIGGFLAIAIIYLFLRQVRSSLVIAISMPLSILLTLICLHAMNITLNMVSVGGIAVGIGMLVDNSIVVLESVTSKQDKGLDVYEASLIGVKQVVGSLIGSTITSICVFFPILLINGLTREIFRDLSWAVIFSLTFSLIVAVTIIPTLYCLLFKRHEFKKSDKIGFMDKMKDWYAKFLTKVLKHKKKTVLFSFIFFALSLLSIFAMKIEFLPSVEQNRINVVISYSGEDYEYCNTKTKEAYDIVKGLENVESSYFVVNYGVFDKSSLSGTITLDVKKKTNEDKQCDLIRDALEKNNFPNAYYIRKQDGVVASIAGSMSSVSLTISGKNVDVLKEISTKVQEKIRQNDGIVSTTDNMLARSTSATIKFDDSLIARYNLDYDAVVKTLRVGLAGHEAAEVEDQKVMVSFSDTTINDYYKGLANYVVGFDNNFEPITLEMVSTITYDNGLHIIRKKNGTNTVDIDIDINDKLDTNKASKLLEKTAKEVLKDYDGYSCVPSGMSYYLDDAFKGLFIALVISIVLLIGVMACIFESIRKPFIIIFSLPFALSGGLLALAMTRVSLSVVSFIGIIMLMGVIVNDAIVLNERYDQLYDEYQDRKKAIINGSKQRLRAVLMTTLTTILALIPMALGIGKGAGLMQPLGVVAIGGLLLGSLVTLVIIPCIYAIIYRVNTND